GARLLAARDPRVRLSRRRRPVRARTQRPRGAALPCVDRGSGDPRRDRRVRRSAGEPAVAGHPVAVAGRTLTGPESEQVRTATPTGAGAGARPRHLRHRHVVVRATRGYRRPPRRDCCGTAVAGPPATRRFVPRLAFLLARRGPLAGWPGRKGPHTGR